MFNQYGSHDCLIDSLVVKRVEARVKISHLGFLSCEHFGFNHIVIFRGCKTLSSLLQSEQAAT